MKYAASVTLFYVCCRPHDANFLYGADDGGGFGARLEAPTAADRDLGR